jgi:DNA replication and repair protein RecF
VRITRLRLYQYRNIGELELYPSAGTSLFSGLNGQGKTNLLESLYLLAYGRSFRTSAPKDCIQHGQRECRVEGTIEHLSRSRDLQIVVTDAEKKLFLLGKPARLDEFVGNLHLLAFTQQHLDVVRGGPADRRAFLDRAMATLYPGHIRWLADYGRALRQRNAILSSAGGAAPGDLVDSWDEALVKPGARILVNRLRYVDAMKQELPQGLFGAEQLQMRYLSTASGEERDRDVIEERFRRRLRDLRSSDQRVGYTSAGPHRDDLKLYLNGKSLADFGSAGQQRSSLLSLYFSQMEIHCKTHGFYPVFLIDDAEAELDAPRLEIFLKYLSDRTQTFLTTAKSFLVSALAENARHFEVQNGIVSTHSRSGPILQLDQT